jgi:lysophospholipase L1-like esterase
MIIRQIAQILITVSLFPLCYLEAQDHSAVTPVPRTGRQMERHNSFNEIVKNRQGDVDLIFVGDSITQGWEGKGKDVWKHYYGHRKAVNLGIGGDRTQHVLWRLDHGNVDGIDPKAAVVMIGTNNSADDRNSATEIVDGVTAVVEKLRTTLPKTKILLLGIFPRGKDFNAQRGKILQVNQAIRKLHDGKNVHSLSIGHHFLSESGELPESIMPDYLHLSPEGYQIWAEKIERRLAKLLGDNVIEAPKNSLSGNWNWTMDGPDNNEASAIIQFDVEGAKLEGTFNFQGSREFKIENGTVSGNKFSFRIKRDRPNGGSMVYQMSGNVAGDSIHGLVKTSMDGSPIEQEWKASRGK